MKNGLSMQLESSADSPRMPSSFLYGVLAVCAAPVLLNFFGIDFGMQATVLDLNWAQQQKSHVVLDAIFMSMKGAITHTVLEWSAFCVALFTVLLAFSQYRITGNIATPIIGVAFFMAGCMDAFHTMAANRLIDAVADNRDLIPFTWAVCRVFNASIMIIGVLILLFGKQFSRKFDFPMVLGLSLAFGGVAYFIISLSATSATLPATMFPQSIISRPYDLLPLLLFLYAGLFIFPRLNQHSPSLFAHALVISAIPQVVTQLHMTFGSATLFDNHFNIAHFMKIVAYFVPFMGLLLDYIRTQKALQREIYERRQTQSALTESETRQRTILNSMADGLVTLDENGCLLSANVAAQRLFDYGADQMVGKNFSQLMGLSHKPSEASAFVQQYLQVADSASVRMSYEVEGRRSNGATFPMEITVSEMSFNDFTNYSVLIRDITERTKLDKMKKEFVSTVSHELRTPLTAIRGSLGLIEGGAFGAVDTQVQSMVRMARTNSERLISIINDILDLEKITAGKMSFVIQPHALAPLIRHSLMANQPYADEYGVHFELIVDILDADLVAVDDTRLAQVMSNLLSNAAKFSVKDSTVKVIVTSKGDWYRIEVIDRGSGIASDYKDRVFERFSQADNSDSRQKGGTGLGLSISKDLIEKMGGCIGFETQLGLGSMFYIELPKLIPTPERESQPAESAKI